MGVKIGVAAIKPQDELARRRELFMNLARTFIKRDGLENVLAWLDDNGFFRDPASTQYHGSVRGGLCAHSLAVFDWIRKISAVIFETDWTTPQDEVDEELRADRETLAIVSLFHDACKVNFYVEETKWKKDKSGNWVSYLAYGIKDQDPWGHGEKSVILLLKLGLKLTDDGFNPRVRTGRDNT